MKSQSARTEKKGDQAGSLVQLAYGAVLARILDGTLNGKELISEGRLAVDLGLSRTPVREAIGRLEGEGLIVRNGRALAVQRLTLSDYLEIHHMRRLLETEAIRLAVGRIPLPDLKCLRAKVAEMGVDVSPPDHWALDDQVHNIIAVASGSSLLAQTISDLRRRTRLFDRSRLPDRFEPGRQEHLKILDALIAQDKGVAIEAMRAHLDGAKSAIMSGIDKFG